MIDQLSELESLMLNRSGETPYATYRREGVNATGIGFLDLVRHFGKKQTTAPKSSTHENASTEPLPDTIQRLLAQSFLASKQSSPIVAVAGVLNAGKSSLVASFLSQSGRSRLLIGSSNEQGTHRFSLWLPESWRKDLLMWENTLSQIENVFGYPPEELSSSQSIAFDQYNGRLSPSYVDAYPASKVAPSILIPLIATDPQLDKYAIGLMDCPDIQTGFFNSELDLQAKNASPVTSHDLRTDTRQYLFADQRRAALEKSLQISSAFVVVSAANSIQDQTVSDILNVVQRVMPGLRTILAVNRVPRRYGSLDISKEIETGYSEIGLWRVYMAYHFEGPLLRERLPRLPDKDKMIEDLPVFFRIDQQPPVQPPSEVKRNDYLVGIGEQLDPSQLSKERVHSTLTSLTSSIDQGIQNIEIHNQRGLARLSRWHQLLAQAIFSLSSQDKSKSSNTGTIRLQMSRELIQQISTSLEKTAPWWAMPGRWAIRWSSKVQEVASDATSWFQISSWIKNRVSDLSNSVTSRLRTGEGGRIISPRDFLETIIAHNLLYQLISNESLQNRKEWEDRLNGALSRFQSESQVRLSDQQLDEYTAEMWRGMSWSQSFLNGVAPAGLIFAPIIAVAMLPFEGGTTAMLAITLKEFLGAGMATVGISMLNRDAMPKLAESETAWNQFCDLFAVCCDELGIARPTTENMPHVSIEHVARTLKESALAATTKQPISVADEIYLIDPNVAKRLTGLLSSLTSRL